MTIFHLPDDSTVVIFQPTLEEMQNVLNKCVQVILKIAEHVPQWEHLINQQRQQQKVSTPTRTPCRLLVSSRRCCLSVT